MRGEYKHMTEKKKTEDKKEHIKMKLELIPMPVSNIDRAIDFYVGKLGFNKDLDVHPNDQMRIVQLTPFDSACSIVLSKGLPTIVMPIGSLRGLHLVVENIYKTRQFFIDKGVEVDEIEEHPQGVKYAAFSDPDGNTWTFQEMPWRAKDFK